YGNAARLSLDAFELENGLLQPQELVALGLDRLLDGEGALSELSQVLDRFPSLGDEQLILSLLDVGLGRRVLERQPVLDGRAVPGEQDQGRRVCSLGAEAQVEQNERIWIEGLAQKVDIPREPDPDDEG